MSPLPSTHRSTTAPVRRSVWRGSAEPLPDELVHPTVGSPLVPSSRVVVLAPVEPDLLDSFSPLWPAVDFGMLRAAVMPQVCDPAFRGCGVSSVRALPLGRRIRGPRASPA